MGLTSMRIVNFEGEMVPVAGVAAQAHTVTNAVKVLGPISKQASHVFITLDGADTRVTFDGSAPDGNTGHFLAGPYRGVWNKRLAKQAKFFRAAGVDVKLFAQEVSPG